MQALILMTISDLLPLWESLQQYSYEQRDRLIQVLWNNNNTKGLYFRLYVNNLHLSLKYSITQNFVVQKPLNAIQYYIIIYHK